MRPRLPLRLFIAALFILSGAPAGCHHAVAPQTRAPFTLHTPYLRAGDFDYKSLLPGPPPDGSPAHVAEINQMLDLQARRTPDEVKRCQAEEEVTVFNFTPVLGGWFTPESVPRTAALMQDVYEEA